MVLLPLLLPPSPPFLLAIFSLALTRKKKFKNYGCSGRGPKFTFGNGALGQIHKLRSAGLSRGALRLLHSSRVALTLPDAFGAGAFPLRRITFASRQTFSFR